MKHEFPKEAILESPYRIKNNIYEAKASFYEFAKEKIKMLDAKDFKKWMNKLSGFSNLEIIKISPAVGIYWPKNKKNKKGEMEKALSVFEIVINKDAFQIDGKNYSDVIPFVAEHELMEAWLHSKKGWGDNKFSDDDCHKKHLLAERREFLLAEQEGLSEKLFEWRMKMDPLGEEEYKYAWESAKKKNNQK
jgi:hypothetical protein